MEDKFKYCALHKVFGHSTQECKVLKGKVNDWIEKGELKVGDEKAAEENIKNLPIILVISVASEFLGTITNQQ